MRLFIKKREKIKMFFIITLGSLLFLIYTFGHLFFLLNYMFFSNYTWNGFLYFLFWLIYLYEFILINGKTQ